MSDQSPPSLKGEAAPALVLCRQCVEYVFAGTVTCPHCGRDARLAGPRYRDEGHAAIEAMRRIEDALARRRR
ncbi:MAG TPA: hypothetical protein VLX44_11915 [Xanthobacteraceae bacterium]|nr:hypothetical protein [Xanthobacteraceae bacterium]